MQGESMYRNISTSFFPRAWKTHRLLWLHLGEPELGLQWISPAPAVCKERERCTPAAAAALAAPFQSCPLKWNPTFPSTPQRHGLQKSFSLNLPVWGLFVLLMSVRWLRIWRFCLFWVLGVKWGESAVFPYGDFREGLHSHRSWNYWQSTESVQTSPFPQTSKASPCPWHCSTFQCQRCLPRAPSRILTRRRQTTV